MIGVSRIRSSRRGRISLLAALVFVLAVAGLLSTGARPAFASDGAVTKVVRSGCYYYQSPSSASSNRAGYLTFGEEVDVLGESNGYAIFIENGTRRYVRSGNLACRSMTIVKNRVQVKTEGKGSAPILCYAYYDDRVSVIDDSGNYVKCVLADGREGYINKAYLSHTAVPKVVNASTNLYAAASSSSSAMPVTAGEEVRMLMSNGAWAKVQYRGKSYFMYSNKLDAKVVRLAVNRAYQMKDARVGAERVQYVYWDKACTVLNTYESDTYGTYYYCKVGSKYGFVRARYCGSAETMRTTRATSLYSLASDSSAKRADLPAGSEVGVFYTNGAWTQVRIGDKVGYVLSKLLAYPRCHVDGLSFATAYQAYAYGKHGTIAPGASAATGSFELRGQSSKYACIITDAGARYVLKRSMSQQPSSIAMYTAVPFCTLYEQPKSSSSSFEVPYMTQISFIEDVSTTGDGTWSKVTYEGAERYVWTPAGASSKLTREKSSFSYEGDNAQQKAVISSALNVLNGWETRYVHGATGELMPGTNVHAFDCSGFASYVLNGAMGGEVPVYDVSANLKKLFSTDVLYNKGLGGEARAKAVWSGGTLDTSSLEPGDLLFFDLASEVDEGAQNGYNHVGVYLGNGEFIHCTHTWDRVIVMPLADLYRDGLVRVLRCLPDEVVSADKTMVTSSTQTKIRSSMNSSDEGNVIGVLDSEREVVLRFVGETGTWGYVKAGNAEGFVLMKYLREQVGVEVRQAYVSVTSVKLYEEAAAGSASIEAYCTEPIGLLGPKGGTSYYQVGYRGETRYLSLHGKTLESVVTEDLSKLLAGVGDKTVGVNTYLRSTPSLQNDENKLTLARKGDRVKVISVSSTGTWAYVEYGDGDRGFILNSKLS